MQEVRNKLDGAFGRGDITEEKINELQDIEIETTQNEYTGKNKTNKRESMSYGGK